MVKQRARYRRKGGEAGRGRGGGGGGRGKEMAKEALVGLKRCSLCFRFMVDTSAENSPLPLDLL